MTRARRSNRNCKAITGPHCKFTPAAGRTEPTRTGLAGWFGKYAEALELMWFQYVVGYDKQEQRSLATNLNNRLLQYWRSIATQINSLKITSSVFLRKGLLILACAVGVLIIILLGHRVRHLGWRRALTIAGAPEVESSAVDFYERLIEL